MLGARADASSFPIDGWAERVVTLRRAYEATDAKSLQLPLMPGAVGLAVPLGLFGHLIRAHPLVVRAAQGMELTTEEKARLYGPVFSLWRGERTPLVGITAVRSIVSSLLALHFRRRLRLLSRAVQVDPRLESKRKLLTEEIERALELWETRRTLAGAITFIVSVLGTVGGLTAIFGRIGDVPVWGWFLLVPAIYVAYVVIVGSFVVKRTLMLGGSASELPGEYAGQGVYGVEREVFEPLGIVRREPPLDLLLDALFLAVFAALGWLLVGFWFALIFGLPLLLDLVAYIRRRQLGRL